MTYSVLAFNYAGSFVDLEALASRGGLGPEPPGRSDGGDGGGGDSFPRTLPI